MQAQQGWVIGQDENSNEILDPMASCVMQWNRKFRRLLKEDRLGETEKCVRHLSMLIAELRRFLKEDKSEESRHMKAVLEKICACLERRKETLLNPKLENSLNYNDVSKLKAVLSNLLSWSEPFPILLNERCQSRTSLESRDSGLCDSFVDDEVIDTKVDKQTPQILSTNSPSQPQLLSPLKRNPNFTRCSISVSKINLKYMDVINPYLMISFRDCDSVNLTPIQNVVPTGISGRDINFDATIHLQRYLEKVPKGSNMFFELLYTSKHGRTVKKCYAILPSQNLVNGIYKLGLYKPPTDYHLKKLSKYTKKKELYLHIEVRVEK